MKKVHIFYLLFFLAPIFFLGCDHNANALSSSVSKVDSTKKVDSFSNADTLTYSNDPTVMQFEITFDDKADNVELKPAKLKYNKRGWASVEWDDNSVACLKAYEKLNNSYYTDGCKNKIRYTGAVGVNGKKSWDNAEVATLPDNISYSQMRTLINNGWDIENHGYYHFPDGNFNFGYDWNKNITELDNLIFDRIQYKMNGSIVPVNYDNFPTAAKNFGYIFCTSQGTHDKLLPAGNPTYKEVQDFDLAPQGFSQFNRIFYDDWAQMEKSVKAAIDDIVLKNNFYFRFASHGIDEAAFGRIIDYFENTTLDNILMIPTREIMEYRIMSSQKMNYQKLNNKMLVAVDVQNLPLRIRWRDLTFLVSGTSKISAIKIISGIDKVSFNSETGLINIFKQINSW